MSTKAQREQAAAPGLAAGVNPNPIDQSTDDDAIDQMSRIVAGNNELITHPHLVTALVTAQATPQESQAINQFMVGMSAYGKVQAAQASNTQIQLAANEKASMAAMGLSPGNTEYTLSDLQKSVELQLNPPSTGGGWGFNLSSVGRAWHDVTHNPVTDVFGKVANAAQVGAGEITSGNMQQSNSTPQLREAMVAAGYDPTSSFSRLAYAASGNAISDGSGLADLYANRDASQVDAAIAYSDNPKAYIEGLINAPGATVESVQASFANLNSTDFKNLVLTVNSKRLTPGHNLANGLNIDPITHPDLYAAVSIPTDIVASFLDDPTMAAGNVVKSIRATQIALDGIGDVNRVREVVDGTRGGVYATRVRTGVQTLIDNAALIRTGDDVAKATGYAQIRSLIPGLQHLLPDFLGKSVASFDKAGKVVFSEGAPITKIDEAADYLASKVGVLRLMSGKPMAEANLMPYQTSLFGLRKIKAALAVKAGTRFGKSTIDLNKPGIAARMIPSLDDAVSLDAEVPAAAGAVGLASKTRAMTDAEKGDARFASLGGNLTGGKIAKVASALAPGALYNRGKLIAQRWGSYLPKDTTFTTGDPGAVEKVFQYANMYLTRSDANLMAARYAAGDEGVRKAILSGLQVQVMHAAGLGTSEAGRGVIDRATQAFADERYSVSAGRFLDPATQTERDAALFPGQVNEAITLRGFQDLQKYAAKIGIWQSTIGRAFNNPVIDNMLKLVRFGWLGTYSNVIRNSGEDLAMSASKGELGDVLRAKAAGNALLPTRSRITNTALAPLNRVGRMYRWAAVNTGGDELGLKYVANLDPELMKQFRDEYVSTHLRAMVDPGGVQDATDITKDGFIPKQLKLRTGYDEVDTGGDIGADRLSQSLAMAINKNPELAKAIIDHLSPATPAASAVATDAESQIRQAYTQVARHPGDYVPLAELRKHLGGLSRDEQDEALKSMALQPGHELAPWDNRKALTDADRDASVRFGGDDNHVLYIEKPGAAAPTVPTASVGLDHVIDTLNSDKRVTQMIRAGVVTDASGVVRPALTAEDKQLAIQQLAEKQVAEYKYLMSDDAGNLNGALADYVREHGMAPGTDWIKDNILDGSRPSIVLAPQFEATPVTKGIPGIVGALSDVAGKGYQALVEKPIARISSMPIFLANYGKTRVFMEGWERELVRGGLTKDAADKAATEISMQMAYQRTLKYIDDPTLRTQMDVVGRNFFAFSRATQAFVRRWGASFVEDPTRLRKVMLAMESAHKSGLTYTDPNGQEQFVFPASGAAIQALMQVADLIPGVDLLKVPGIMPNLTGKVGYLSPGLSNPMQMSLTPMANIPMRAVFKLFPQHRQALDQIDAAFNGSQGQGASPLSELEPTVLKKFSDAYNSNDQDSLMADATRSALLNLMAANKVPGYVNGQPDPLHPADAAQTAEFLSNVQAQVKNQLYIRAVFGFATPAPPGVPTEDTSGSSADWFAGAMGAHGLDDEYKMLLNEAGGDVGLAGQLWAGLHPDKQYYTTGTTTAAEKSTGLVATAASAKWIEDNADFMRNYSGVAAYFVPKNLQTGQFDLGAYNAELELGIRQHKTTAEFFNDVLTANAASEYYQLTNWRDEAIQANPSNTSAIKAQFTTEMAEFNSLNPLWAASQSDYSSSVTNAKDQLTQLRRLTTSNNVPSDVPVGAVAQAVNAYDTYHLALASYPDSTNAALAAKADLAGQYNTWWMNELQNNPQLTGLYAGVFRTLDNKALDPIGNS